MICGDKANLKEVVLPKQPVELEGMVVVGYAIAGQNATSKEGEIFTAVEEMPVFKEGNVLAYMAGWSNILSGLRRKEFRVK